MKILKLAYQVLSGMAFAIIIMFLILGAYSITSSSRGATELSPGDVVFVLNHGNIVTDQNYEVIYSFQSGSSFNGDHLDYYCLQLEKFEFQKPKENEWVYGPEKNEIYIKARSSVATEGKMGECFKGEYNSNSEDITAKIWSLDIRRDYIEGALLILFHKPTNRLLYVSSRT